MRSLTKWLMDKPPLLLITEMTEAWCKIALQFFFFRWNDAEDILRLYPRSGCASTFVSVLAMTPTRQVIYTRRRRCRHRRGLNLVLISASRETKLRRDAHHRRRWMNLSRPWLIYSVEAHVKNSTSAQIDMLFNLTKRRRHITLVIITVQLGSFLNFWFSAHPSINWLLIWSWLFLLC